MDESEHTPPPTESLQRRRFSRKKLLAAAGAAGAVSAASLGGIQLFTGTHSAKADAGSDNDTHDTPQQIFTAALIAEDLATTFYYNALIGPVIHDRNLAGGGTATDPAKKESNPGNVDYLRAALNEEIQHANLMRALIGGSSAGADPVQTFYFGADNFASLDKFLALLDALESAFIGAYLSATQEFAAMAADTKAGITTFTDPSGKAYASSTLEYFAKVASSIGGVEAEHRVLGRVIGNMNPANQLNYEQADGITSVYNGSNSAVVALTPFLSASAGGHAYSLGDALAAAPGLIVSTSGGLPTAS